MEQTSELLQQKVSIYKRHQQRFTSIQGEWQGTERYIQGTKARETIFSGQTM